MSVTRVETTYYHTASPSTSRDAGGRTKVSSLIDTNSSIDPQSAECCSLCCRAVLCSPSRTTSQKVAKIGAYTLIGAGAGAFVGTFIVPGLGTAGGAVLGGLAGAGIGTVVVLSEES